jgi:hypothetical protein
VLLVCLLGEVSVQVILSVSESVLESESWSAFVGRAAVVRSYCVGCEGVCLVGGGGGGVSLGLFWLVLVGLVGWWGCRVGVC